MENFYKEISVWAARQPDITGAIYGRPDCNAVALLDVNRVVNTLTNNSFRTVLANEIISAGRAAGITLPYSSSDLVNTMNKYWTSDAIINEVNDFNASQNQIVCTNNLGTQLGSHNNQVGNLVVAIIKKHFGLGSSLPAVVGAGGLAAAAPRLGDADSDNKATYLLLALLLVAAFLIFWFIYDRRRRTGAY